MILKEKIVLLLAFLILLNGCAGEERGGKTTVPTTEAIVTGESPEAATWGTAPKESPEVTEATVSETTAEHVQEEKNENAKDNTSSDTEFPQTDTPAEKNPQTPVPEDTTPPGTKPPQETIPVDTKPTEDTTPPDTQPPETEPPKDTTPPETQPTETEPHVTEPVQPTESFKREVARAAAKYLNRYREQSGVKSCTILPGMTLVAEYRADQLTWNFSHSTQDKREALAYYRYGRYVDATLEGLEESDSYYEADSAEAICAGFHGPDADAMGKYIADQIRNSGSHWRYVGSSEYSYIGVGVEYREGSEYGWYACIMVGMVDYG